MDRSAPGIEAEGLTIFLTGHRDGLDHGLAKIGECRGDFGLDLAMGDGAEEPSHGGAKIAGGEQVS